MGKLVTIQGDVTHPIGEGEKSIIIPHVVNDIGRWGSGFVNAITARWGEGPRELYIGWHARDGGRIDRVENEYNVSTRGQWDFALGKVQIVDLPNDIAIANMVGQHGVAGMALSGRPPIRYGALTFAMAYVLGYANRNNTEIHCPKFGSDLAGGDWNVIEQMIQEIWVDNGIDVYVYEYKP